MQRNAGVEQCLCVCVSVCGARLRHLITSFSCFDPTDSRSEIWTSIMWVREKEWWWHDGYEIRWRRVVVLDSCVCVCALIVDGESDIVAVLVRWGLVGLHGLIACQLVVLDALVVDSGATTCGGNRDVVPWFGLTLAHQSDAWENRIEESSYKWVPNLEEIFVLSSTNSLKDIK